MDGTAQLYRAHDPLLSYREVRAHTESLARPLSAEDQMVQSMPDVSPTKWHLAHTSWFFETFLLRPELPEYRVFHPKYEVLFNSYYNSVGAQFTRSRRGMLSRPSKDEVLAYRQHVDEGMCRLLDSLAPQVASLVELGLHHEQQHQELLLTDIKHVLSQNPVWPAYMEEPKVSEVASRTATELTFVPFEGGTVQIGHQGEGFHFDNEGPAHLHLLDDFQLASRPLNDGDVLEFIQAGGYDDPLLWLSDGWAFKSQNQLRLPQYWQEEDGLFQQFTLHGLQAVNPAATACHLTYFEADAIARFMGARLPTEQEWETAARRQKPVGQAFSPNSIRPGVPTSQGAGQLDQLIGGVWEWTQSPYTAYPKYSPQKGAVGEYNGKFMHNQMVLRGGSCATPDSHIRLSYRNFFPSHASWQFSGARLAKGNHA